jgi:membrane protein YqaA with SNARE-associated domain
VGIDKKEGRGKNQNRITSISIKWHHGIIPQHMDETKAEKQGSVWWLAWLRKRLVPLAGLLLAIAIMVGIVCFYFQNPDIFRELRAYGYLGAFVISVILNATILLPVSNMAIIMTLGATLPSPVIVGVLGGLGAAIGELTGYIAGRSGRGLLAKISVYNRVEGWVKRWGWIAVFVLSIFPFVFDIVGIIAGALRMPLWKFFVACWLGRTISYVFMAYMASLGFKAIPWFN